jgi:OOP family OmpA-OmpF porin
MRSSLALFLLLAACAKTPGAPVCAPTASWASPAFRCAAPAVAVVEPAVEPEPEVVPDEPEPEPAAVVESETIELKEQVQFETGSAVLLASSRSLLDEVARLMTDHPEIRKVEIRGHTDGDGSRDHNQRLSDRRAAAVRTHLIGAGVAKARLTSRGFGEDQPIADNESDEGKAQNRRVELRILERD